MPSAAFFVARVKETQINQLYELNVVPDTNQGKVMKHKLQKFLSLLLVLCAAITISAGNITQGTFKQGGSWKISEAGELYIDAEKVPDYGTQSTYDRTA